MNSSTERKGVASDEDLAQLRNQYKGLHSNKQCDDDQSLNRLLGASSVRKVKEYLDGLAEAYSKAGTVHENGRNTIWVGFLLRQPRARARLLDYFELEEGGDLDNKFVKLAFFHQYPRWAQDEDVSMNWMLNALLANSMAAGEDLLAVAVPDPEHMQIIQAGYQHEYLRHETIVLPILTRLGKGAQEWSADHLAPLTSLIGPSMIGKTRLLQQLAKSICVVYLCLRPHASSGEPPRSKLADQMVPVRLKSDELELEYTRLLCAIFQVVAEFFSSQSAHASEEERLTKWFEFNDKCGNEFASRVDDKVKKTPDNRVKADTLLTTSLKELYQITCFIENPHLKLLLAIDEARTLVELETNDPFKVSYFRILRRVLSQIPTSSGFFALVTDTTVTVADFNHTLINDPSARPEPGSKPKLTFEPIYDIGTFDSKVPPGRPRTWEALLSPQRLFSYGFPIFRIYVETAEARKKSIPEIIKNLREFAIEKLLCNSRVAQLSEGQLFALLGPTIQPQIYEAARLNSELISSHLALCLYISPSRERIISEYPSQFTLSMAANYFLARGEDRMICCIKALTVILRQGLISSGNAGELASRIILLLAMHKAMDSNGSTEIPYGCSVRLVDFLCALTGQVTEKVDLENLDRRTKKALGLENLDLGDIAPEHQKRLLTEGRLFWNHFVQITYTPHKADFLEFLYRGLAIQCKPNQPSFDQLFTIYLEPGGSTSELNEDRISFCGVQAKNGGVDWGKEMPKWTDDNAGIKINKTNPYLVLVFSFKTSYTRQTLPKVANRGYRIFHGLTDIKCLSDGISNALKELLAVEEDVRAFYNDDHMRKFVQTSRPAVYPIKRRDSDDEINFDSNINPDGTCIQHHDTNDEINLNSNIDPDVVGTCGGSDCEMND
ncbi:hypothetical protein PTTG_09451 [Puccinia triticina 1-1 BBBD Race 1]|uniref:Uncharacterized protein n=1 Tax=Puccinia triticina (isolate 1-1 / race 1 (BBBD)) TaxID=630390 RepID=A0A180G9R7_PUCT1|nr:hypothetical protein PTTG_09451 [Puccinia triticina 1-1 BBBD Race 1]